MPDKERAISLFSDYGVPDMFLNDLYDEIEECFALELDKAEKWDKVIGFAYNNSDCTGCKYDHEGDCVLDGMCCFKAVVDALRERND